MTNSEKYRFSDFTVNHYIEILKIAIQKFDFMFFHEAIGAPNEILWRHDVDFSIERSLKLAQLESKLKVKSTFFFLLHSEFYSFFEKDTFNIVKEIFSLGHEIGLHFDPHFYDISKEEELYDKIKEEKRVFEKLLGFKIKAISFHNTDDFIMSCKSKNYCGLINTYSGFFQSQYRYCSDSNGYWRHERLFDFLLATEPGPIQVLTHPEWWTDVVMSPKEKINDCVEKRALYNKKLYTNILKFSGRENIDW